MDCHCFEYVLVKDLPDSNNTEEFLKQEIKLCSDLYWEINKHKSLYYSKVFFKNRKKYFNEEKHYEMFQTKKNICFNQKFYSGCHYKIYQRHLEALNVLENELNRTKQHGLDVYVHRSLHGIHIGRTEIQTYICSLRKYLISGIPDENLKSFEYTGLETQLQKYVHTLKLIQLFYTFQDCH